MESKNVESKFEKKLTLSLEKINPQEIIKEALSTIPKKEENTKEINNNLKISEQLNRIKMKALDEYLQSIRHKKLKELKDGIGEEMDKYNKNVSSLLVKSNTDLNEANKNIANLKNQIADLNNKIDILQKHNKELLIKIQDLETYLVNLEKEYSMVMNEKQIFDEIKKVYPGLTLSEMILEIQMAKKGSLKMLESYSDKNKELLDLKKSQKESNIYYQKKINSLMEEIRQISIGQKEDKERYQKQIEELNNKIEMYESRIKESDYLRNSLYYLYNVLFEKIDLMKDIKIDDKFRKQVDEKDFTPNILYEPELVSYIDILIKRMHPDSYDKLFRECVGYLNAIVKNFFPDNTKLRFRPVEIFREISNLIHEKIKLITEYKNSVKYKESQINTMQMEINKLKEKNENLAKEYNSYKILVEKTIKFTKNNTNNNIKNNVKEKTYKTISNINFKHFNINSKKIKNQRKKGIYFKDQKFSFDVDQNLNSNDTNKENDKKELSRNEKRKRALSSFKMNSIYYKFRNKYKSQKNIKQIDIYNDNNGTDEIWSCRIKRSENDHLKIENGNQNTINSLNAFNELIDETNRLFLYRTRINSFQKNIKAMGLEDGSNSIKKREINKNLKEKLLGTNSIKTFEGKILKKLDNLISSSKMK